MDISVLMPCFNNAEYVAQAVDSVLTQDFNGSTELIVVDDGSNDDSLRILQSFGKNIILVSQPNQGACVARNRALAFSSGRYVKFLDADDCLGERSLSEQFALAQSMPEKSIVYGRHVLMRKGSPSSPAVRTDYTGMPVSISRLMHETLLVSEPLYPREALIEVDGFNSAITRGQEFEMNLRLWLAGWDFIYYPILALYYRDHDAPQRISNFRSRSFCNRDRDLMAKMMDLAATGVRKGQHAEMKSAVSRVFWLAGRELARGGESARAREYFAAARKLSGSSAVQGRWPYRVLERCLGPVVAERIPVMAHAVTRKILRNSSGG